jgi:hypothetical protein
VQQWGRGQSIAWGTYPNAKYSGTQYVVNVYANGTKIDGKRQLYAPHGSLSAARALKYSGKILKINGTVLRGDRIKLSFSLQCTIA